MTAHRHYYPLWIGGRWIATCACCYGQTLDLPAPGCKPRRAA